MSEWPLHHFDEIHSGIERKAKIKKYPRAHTHTHSRTFLVRSWWFSGYGWNAIRHSCPIREFCVWPKENRCKLELAYRWHYFVRPNDNYRFFRLTNLRPRRERAARLIIKYGSDDKTRRSEQYFVSIHFCFVLFVCFFLSVWCVFDFGSAECECVRVACGVCPSRNFCRRINEK